MTIKFGDIEDAFFFVSMAQQYIHSVYLCKETGHIFYTSEMGDSDELPEDIDESDKYIAVISHPSRYFWAVSEGECAHD